MAGLLGVPLTHVRAADQHEDYNGVDTIVGGVRLNLRTRRHAYHMRFGVQPTLRLFTGPDGRNELDKLILGNYSHMLISYATPNASRDDQTDDDTLTSTTLLDAGPIRRAAAAGFHSVTISRIDADRCHSLALSPADLMATYGPCVVRQTTETITEGPATVVAPPVDPVTGLVRVTTETDLTRRVTDTTNPDLLTAARRLAAAA